MQECPAPFNTAGRFPQVVAIKKFALHQRQHGSGSAGAAVPFPGQLSDIAPEDVPENLALETVHWIHELPYIPQGISLQLDKLQS